MITCSCHKNVWMPKIITSFVSVGLVESRQKFKYLTHIFDIKYVEILTIFPLTGENLTNALSITEYNDAWLTSNKFPQKWLEGQLCTFLPGMFWPHNDLKHQHLSEVKLPLPVDEPGEMIIIHLAGDTFNKKGRPWAGRGRWNWLCKLNNLKCLELHYFWLG